MNRVNKVKFILEFYKLWKIFSGQRFGQLLLSIIDHYKKDIDLFYLSDEQLLIWIKKLQNKEEWFKIIDSFKGFENEKRK